MLEVAGDQFTVVSCVTFQGLIALCINIIGVVLGGVAGLEMATEVDPSGHALRAAMIPTTGVPIILTTGKNSWNNRLACGVPMMRLLQLRPAGLLAAAMVTIHSHISLSTQ